MLVRRTDWWRCPVEQTSAFQQCIDGEDTAERVPPQGPVGRVGAVSRSTNGTISVCKRVEEGSRLPGGGVVRPAGARSPGPVASHSYALVSGSPTPTTRTSGIASSTYGDQRTLGRESEGHRGVEHVDDGVLASEDS